MERQSIAWRKVPREDLVRPRRRVYVRHAFITGVLVVVVRTVVEEARKISNADGGTLYIMSDDNRELRFAIVQTGTLNIRMGGTGGEISWKPVRLYNSDATPNHGNVSAHVALSGSIINMPDVYDSEGFDFKGTRSFDAQTGYRSKSMLVVPMKDHRNDIIGVLQLINARDAVGQDVVPFSRESQEMTESLASLAAVALSNNRLILELENLMESFIRAIATAIDEKSPYTGGHVRRVAELTMDIARKINETTEGSYAEVHFSDDELKELQTAAWLHDVGKITTPEYVIDKATKLETVHDGIELLRLRFALIDMQEKIRRLQHQKSPVSYSGEHDAVKTQLAEELRFLSETNLGSERMSDEKMDHVRAIAARTWEVNGKQETLLTKEEAENLNIRQGTLNTAEREIVQNHAAVTHKILCQLPFPKKLRHVPEYAAAHHETLNGKGYPQGPDAGQLALQSRILALADVFEALTARDRPYKSAKTLAEAMQIMDTMVNEQHIDPELFELFKREGIYLDYAHRELAPQQIDLPDV
ncbi:MAG: HD domain-containing protein [Proteobacteria bacterium]|nr:HD domain-containing protein [Pseudomonadota bacterium]